ncbi:hypothetical protein [Pediococcus parvulus]
MIPPSSAVYCICCTVKITSWGKTNKNMKLHESWYMEK